MQLHVAASGVLIAAYIQLIYGRIKIVFFSLTFNWIVASHTVHLTTQSLIPVKAGGVVSLRAFAIRIRFIISRFPSAIAVGVRTAPLILHFDSFSLWSTPATLQIVRWIRPSRSGLGIFIHL